MRRVIHTNLTPAEAWCWVAWMLWTEVRELDHAWPPVEGNHEKAAELEQQADAFLARARSLDADAGLWQRALGKWDALDVPGGAP